MTAWLLRLAGFWCYFEELINMNFTSRFCELILAILSVSLSRIFHSIRVTLIFAVSRLIEVITQKFSMFPLWIGLAVFLGSAGNVMANITFNFTLPLSSTTSAAVYNSDGKLVRTLWRKVTYTAGAKQASWNGALDNGSVAPNGNYQIKLLAHNVNYVWEGVIGNTDTSFTSAITGGDTLWRGLDLINDMSVSGADIFIANGYAEGNANAFRATTLAPNTPRQMVFNGGVNDAATQFRYTATDGIWTYFASSDDGFNNASFVVAYQVSDSTPALFPFSNPFTATPWPGGYTYPSAIDITTAGPGNTSVNPVRGLAVQQSGNLLAVSHSGTNQVRLFNKRSGQLLGSLAITNPGKVAFSPSTGDLWVITGTSVKRYTAAQLAGVTVAGVALTAATTIVGLSSPQALAVDPRVGVDLLLVTDSGTSQQIKGFTSTGAVATAWLTPLGTLGGYNAINGNYVSNTKFWFGTQAQFTQGYIAFQPDGSFWVGDPGNSRNLHFSNTRAYLDQIAFIPRNYTISSDTNAPTRVIGRGWLEYQIDYSKPLLPGDPNAAGGNGSWKLLRNWLGGVSDQYSASNVDDGLASVFTLSNGRTYGLANSITHSQLVVELPKTGLLRATGLTNIANRSFYANGDMRSQTLVNGVQTVNVERLSGFDAAGNPQWSSPSILTSAPAGLAVNGARDPYYNNNWSGLVGPQFPITDSNVIISFDQSVNNSSGVGGNTGKHLGGMAVGGSAWLWQASPGVTTADYLNPAEQDGRYDIGDGINYGGNTVNVNGRNIIYGFHGEGWKGGQANQFMHFYEDGLFIGQFGVPNLNYLETTGVGVAGNAFASRLIKANGNTYLYHGDEGRHAGIHRWRIDGLDAVVEMGATGAQNGTNVSTVSLTKIPATPSEFYSTLSNGNVVLSWTAVAGATSYAIYRGTKPSGEGLTPLYTGITDTSKLDPITPSGAIYYYKIAAVNSGGLSGFSSEGNTATLVTITATSSTPGPITFTVRVTGVLPTGTVQFKDNGINTGFPVALVNGIATFNTTVAAGHTITAVYSGDSNNPASIMAVGVAVSDPSSIVVPAVPEWGKLLLAFGLIYSMNKLNPRGVKPFVA